MFSIDGNADAAAELRIRTGWNKFRQLIPLLTNKDISLIVRGRLYSSCVRSSTLHGSETWPIRKENEVALQRADMTTILQLPTYALPILSLLMVPYQKLFTKLK